MIGKTILDSIGLTEKLGGTIQPKIEPIVQMNTKQFDTFKADLDKLEKDPVQVDLYLKAHGLEQVERLKDYILNNDVKQDSVNDLITQQNYTNIAEQAHGFKGVKQAIDEYNKGIKEGTLDTEKFVSTINTSNSSFGKYLTGLNGAEAGMGKYAISLVGAKIKTVALQTATMALNAGISLAISAAISFAVKKFDEYIHRVDNAKEAMSEFASEAKSGRESLASQKSWIDNNGKEFEKLAKGVNAYGENISLTADEFANYNSMANEVAEMFPTMVSGYTEQGNAIINLKNGVKDLTSAYKENKDAYYAGIIKNGEETFDNFKTEVNDSGKSNGKSKKSSLYQQKVLKQLLNGELDVFDIYTGEYKDYDASGIHDIENSYIKDALKEAGFDYSAYLKDPEAEKKRMASVLSSLTAEINAYSNDITPLLDAYLYYDEDGYQKLTKESKNIVDNIVHSFSSEFIAGKDYDELTILVSSIASQFKGNKKLKEAFDNLFNFQVEDSQMTYKQFEDYYNEIEQFCSQNGIEIPVAIKNGKTEKDALTERVKEKLGDKFGDRIDELSLWDLNIIDKQFTVPEISILSWDKLIAKINEYKETQNSAPDASTKLNFKETIAELDKLDDKFSALDSAYSKFIDKDSKIGFSDISSLTKQFKDIKGASKYIKQIQEANGDVKKTQEAFNGLTAVLLKQSGILDKVTDKNKDLVISMLEEMGVANADSIVTEQVAVNKLRAKIETEGLTNKTWELIESFANEQGASKETIAALAQLELQKLATSDEKIETSEDVGNILDMAEAAGAGAKAVAALAKAKSILAQVESGSASGKLFLENGEYDEAKNLLQSIENGTYDFDFDIDRSKYTGITTTTSDQNSNAKASDSVTTTKDEKTWDGIADSLDKISDKISLIG